MGRERREYNRDGHKRKFKKLFVIATEGTRTEKDYLEAFADSDFYRKNQVSIKILPTANGKSSPRNVIKRLDEFKRTYLLDESDGLWMLIDYDKWGIVNIKQIAQECEQKGYYLAVSYPCFELWLLLHFTDVSVLDEEAKEKLLSNKKIGKGKNRTYIEGELIKVCHGYKKSNLNCSQFIPKVKDALNNAKKLHTNDSATQRWPEGLGTFVYKLIEELLKN